MRKSSVLIASARLLSRNDGQSVSTTVKGCLDKWKIQNKFIAITLDNGAEMCYGINLLESQARKAGLHT